MLFDMSISGGILILWILLLRVMAKRHLPKRFFVLMWQIVLLRLLIPYSIPVPYGMILPVKRLLAYGKRFAEQQPEPGTILLLKMGGQKAVAQTTSGEAMQMPWTMVVWLVIMVVLALFFGYRYYQESRRLKMAIPVSGATEERIRALGILPGWVRVFVSDQITTPITFGLYRPRIIFPKLFLSSEEEEMKYVLTHEWIHIRRADNLWKIITIAAVCVHWFNPMVWLVYIFINRDMELACDEKVISKWGTEVKEDYAMALIRLAEKQYQWSLFTNGFGKNAIQERIVAIMRFKKTTCVSAVCAAVLLIGAATVFSQGNKVYAENAPTKVTANAEKTAGQKKSAKEADLSDNSDSKSFQVTYTTTNADNQKISWNDDGEEWITMMHPEDEKITYIIDGKEKKSESEVTQSELLKLAKAGRLEVLIEKDDSAKVQLSFPKE